MSFLISKAKKPRRVRRRHHRARRPGVNSRKRRRKLHQGPLAGSASRTSTPAKRRKSETAIGKNSVAVQANDLRLADDQVENRAHGNYTADRVARGAIPQPPHISAYCPAFYR